VPGGRDGGGASGIAAADHQHIEIVHRLAGSAARVEGHFRTLTNNLRMDANLSTTVDTLPTSEERNWAMAAHLSALIAVAGLPFGHVVGPLVVYLAKHKESAFVAEHSRSSLNYQITLSLAMILAIVVGIIAFAAVILVAGVGSPRHEAASDVMGAGMVVLFACVFGAIGVVFVLSLVFIIMGTVAASAGKPYTYPFAINFVR
jgi:uncharacterized Tic20 family protein